MTHIITVANNKGGVGKTTSVYHLLNCLASKGKKCLGVDLDPQRNLSLAFNIDNRSSIVDAFMAYIQGEEVNVPLCSVNEELDILGATPALEKIEQLMIGESMRESILVSLLTPIIEKGIYDYIIIDTRPSMGILTTNSLVVSTHVIVPIETDYFAIQGVVDIIKKLQNMIAKVNPSLDVVGFFATKYTKGVGINDKALNYLIDEYRDLMFKTVIRKNSALSDAISLSKSITSYNSKSNGATDYLALTEELISRINKK